MGTVKDQTFCLREGEHQCVVAGRVHGPWPDRGAALAGMQVEQRRAAARAGKVVECQPPAVAGTKGE